MFTFQRVETEKKNQAQRGSFLLSFPTSWIMLIIHSKHSISRKQPSAAREFSFVFSHQLDSN
jgi:hypothetical protein